MNGQMRIIDYTLSDVFTLDPENRWVVKAKLVPWEMAEENYAHIFQKNGRKAKDMVERREYAQEAHSSGRN